MIFEQNYSLLSHNTFRLQARARYFIEYGTVNELTEALSIGEQLSAKIFHIGKGSNLLFTADFEGLILHSAIKGFERIADEEDFCLLRIGAGETWDDVVAYCVHNKLYGAENLSLIPGELGAAAVQNIGAYGTEIQDIIELVETIEIDTHLSKKFTKDECGYAYRESVFKKELKDKHIITHVTLRLSKTERYELKYGNIRDSFTNQDEINLDNVRETIIRIRESKLPDPEKIGNAGSFFMNPYVSKEKFEELLTEYPNMPHYPVSQTEVKIPAGWLIEQCGWKGKTIGNAGVYEKQSLVLTNNGNATAEEIVNLSGMIQQSVLERFGIQLTPEVLYV